MKKDFGKKIGKIFGYVNLISYISIVKFKH